MPRRVQKLEILKNKNKEFPRKSNGVKYDFTKTFENNYLQILLSF